MKKLINIVFAILLAGLIYLSILILTGCTEPDFDTNLDHKYLFELGDTVRMTECKGVIITQIWDGENSYQVRSLCTNETRIITEKNLKQ